MREYTRGEAYQNRDAKENKQSLRDMLKELGREWKASYSNRLKELETPPEFLQKAFQLAQSISYKDHQRSPDEILRLGHIEKTYIFSRPVIEKASSGFRLFYKNNGLNPEIFNQKDNIILSLYAKSRENDGKYVGVSVPSAHRVSSENTLVQWAGGAPDNIISDIPLGLAIVKMNIAKMLFDPDNEVYLDYFTHLFDEVRIDLYKVKDCSDDM
jgi:hypothetical protein